MRSILLIFLLSLALANPVQAAEKARHVVLMVWDGMRPDFISETNTPALYALAKRGVFFKENHSAFLTSTEVNGTVLATGTHPQHSGIIGNVEYFPKVNPRSPVGTESLDTMRKAERFGSYLNAPTVAEILQKNGLRTAVAGTKPVVFLHDHAERPDDSPNPVLGDTRTLPPPLLAHLTNVLGRLPEVGATKTNRDVWTTHSLIGPMWEKGVPAFSVLWMGEPDNSQHQTGPGSPRSLAVIRNNDYALSLVIAALKEKGVYDDTDIFVVSDHGFSSVVQGINSTGRLRQQGFHAAREFQEPPQKGDLLVIGLGGAALIYVAEHDEPTIDRVVKFLQTQDYMGVILTRTARPGTFPLADAMIDSPQAPDVVFSYRWSDAKNIYGIPGDVFSDAGATNSTTATATTANLRGTHVSLSRYDLHNTLVAAGPDFREGFVNETPSGNVDVAPTVMHVLGIKPPQPMDGRVLFEALKTGDAKAPTVKKSELKSQAKLADGQWTQQMTVSEVNGVRYIEEGIGKFVPETAPQNPDSPR